MKQHNSFGLNSALILNDTKLREFYQSLSNDDKRFVVQKISRYPNKIQRIILESYRLKSSPFEANTYLRELTSKLDKVIPKILLAHFDAGEHELRELSKRMANQCVNYEIRALRNLSSVNSNESMRDDAKSSKSYFRNGFEREHTYEGEVNLRNASRRNGALESVYKWCIEFVTETGLVAPKIQNNQPIEGCIKRMQDSGWWLRKLRKLLKKSKEIILIHLEQVNKHKGIYCSDLTVIDRKYQKQQQEEMLKSLVMSNELGEQFSLYDIYEKNISNPTLRRNELMTRASGFENMAKEHGNVGIFVTLTCPSKYHNAYSKSGQRNPKWQGLTPYDGQQYLCSTWAKIRAELARQDIRTYGLRIAEPQHDGTPHWHLMLFVEQPKVEAFKNIIMHYSFEVDGDEQGARENRVKFVDIDPKKGSATGYIAKYVCKNIDGANLDKGAYGENPIEAAQRVEAWASCWGIRQFQQIGGVSVTVWRELRRLRKPVYEDKTLTEIHKAADSGNWATYTKLMGGVFCIRKSQTIRPYYEMVFNKTTGLIKTSWFDGLITKKLKGILHKGQEIITRIHTWQISAVKNGKAGTDFLPSLGVL